MAAKAESLKVTLTPAPVEGGAILATAQALIVSDKATHAICRETISGAKALKRTIEEHYKAIKGPINAARQAVLDMEKASLSPVEEAIRHLERIDVAYVREQDRIAREVAEAARREAEELERARRAEEQARAEADALALEASSDALSAREQIVAGAIVLLLIGPAHHASLSDWEKACRAAGYADPKAAADRLSRSGKVGVAIADRVTAEHRRREAQEAAKAPIVVSVAPVVSEVAEVVGTSVRTYYGCADNVDVIALAKAVIAGTVPAEAILPNMPHLNQAARSLKTHFPKVYPGCSLSQKDGITSRGRA